MARIDKRWWLLGALALLLGAWVNVRFAAYTQPALVLQMNDVEGIVGGYEATPNLLVDGLRWWHGRWIQTPIGAFRPLGSYLLWLEVWLGFHIGFGAVALVGLALLLLDALLAAALTRRLTESWLLAALTAGLAPLMAWFNSGQSAHWLVWFPSHPELLCGALLLGSLLALDRWATAGDRRHLALGWAAFVAGCLVKEYLYVFPAMAGAWALLRPGLPAARRVALGRQALAMGVFVVALYSYRGQVVEDAYGPSLKPGQIPRKMLLSLSATFGRFVLPAQPDYWLPGLALLITLLLAAGRRLRAGWPGAWWTHRYALLTVAAAVLVAYASTAPDGAAVVFAQLVPGESTHLRDVAVMVLTLYGAWLAVREHVRRPLLLGLALLAVGYVPLIDYIGWHYMMIPWLLWSVVWALLVESIWMDLGRPGEELIAAPTTVEVEGVPWEGSPEPPGPLDPG